MGYFFTFFRKLLRKGLVSTYSVTTKTLFFTTNHTNNTNSYFDILILIPRNLFFYLIILDNNVIYQIKS